MGRQMLATLLSLVRVARKSRYPRKLPEFSKNDSCFVLGNGPSLFSDLNGRTNSLRSGDIMCVNLFAESDLYQQIEPRYYIFADPAFWEATVPENMVQMRRRCFDHILTRTTWDIIIAAPFEARALFESVFSKGATIRLMFFNNVPLWGNKRVLHLLYSLGLGLPSAQNVLIPALYLALRLGYKNIVLLGADHSWHESVSLDAANRVCLKDRHFYDQEAELKPFSMDGSAERLFTMDSLFHALATMFEGYRKIEDYSRHLGARISNASSVTFIDAFKRRSLSNVMSDLANQDWEGN